MLPSVVGAQILRPKGERMRGRARAQALSRGTRNALRSLIMSLSRRDLLKLTALAATTRGASAQAMPPKQPDVEVELRAEVGRVVVDPKAARATEVMRFEGRLLRGRASALSAPTGGYLGPTFRIMRGERVRVHFRNGLSEPTIVHWHGLHVGEANDGHPRFAVGPGGTYEYDFIVDDRPGTYWYHPHPHDRTGAQVYRGLAGLFLVIDPDDSARGLPSGEFDLPLVLQERLLGDDGELVYDFNAMSGFLGTRTFVNGVAANTTSVASGSYRLRLVNGSNARIYKLGWSDGSPITVIGTDGGLLAEPRTRPYVMLTPGQRIEVWADFGQTPRGDEVWLESRAFLGGGGMMGMGMRMGRRAGPPNGAAFKVCRFVVNGKGKRLPLPRAWQPLAFARDADVVNLGDPRLVRISMSHMQWLLNDRPFGMLDVAKNERVRLNTSEDWLLENTGFRMSMPHPIHLHGGQFEVVARSVLPTWNAEAESVREGLIDEGWRDTVLVMPGERVKLRMRFDRHAGLFLYHCHNLEHEDMGMMRNFRVEA
jgi:FtsP/CotA-like multicopper oxidase with cupredoxin domain